MKYSLFVHTYNDETNQFLRLMQSDDLATLGQALKDFEDAWKYNRLIDAFICEFLIAHDNDYHKRVYQYEIDDAMKEDNNG